MPLATGAPKVTSSWVDGDLVYTDQSGNVILRLSPSGATVPAIVGSVTATGATGSTATALGSVTPAYHAVTGASGAGVGLPTGPAGAVHVFRNNMTGAMNIYCVGGTINGATGTTAYPVTATGNKMAFAFCLNATGAWQVGGNT